MVYGLIKNGWVQMFLDQFVYCECFILMPFYIYKATQSYCLIGSLGYLVQTVVCISPKFGLAGYFTSRLRSNK